MAPLLNNGVPALHAGLAATQAHLQSGFAGKAAQPLQPPEEAPGRAFIKCATSGSALLGALAIRGVARRRAVGQKYWRAVALRASATTTEAAGTAPAFKTREAKAFKNSERFKFEQLSAYELEELEELYIDALWYHFHDEQELLTKENFDKLKAKLKELEAPLLTLHRDEVSFIEACISYYRGEPVFSDAAYKELRQKVSKSGRRKDMTAFILYERAKQFLSDEELVKLQDAFSHATNIDFNKLDSYPVAELDELYIDALWCYHREGRALLSDSQFDKLKQVLYQRGSRFPTLKRFEVAFVEASIARFRGDPVVSEKEFQQLKAEVEASGSRKDVTAFLLYERGEQFMDGEQFAAMKDEYENLGITAVNLDQCSMAQMEEMYVDALWAYYHDGVQLLNDAQFEKLKFELECQGSGFPFLHRYEIDFVKASLAYHRGEPVVSDEEWQELKKKVTQEGRRIDVTAFLLYTKGQEVLDPETFDKMQKEMAKMGVIVQKAGTKAIEQTLSITSAELENDLIQVFFMIAALAAIPTILSTGLVWAVALFFDFGFVPEAEWGAILTAEFLPVFAVGLLGGIAVTNQLLNFLDLQNPEILVGECPSCASEIRLFSGGAAPEAKTNYACKACGCKMVLDTRGREITLAGSSATVDDPSSGFDWRKAWGDLKKSAGRLVSS